MLGSLFAEGRLVTADLERAVAAFERSAQQGYHAAYNSLGNSHDGSPPTHTCIANPLRFDLFNHTLTSFPKKKRNLTLSSVRCVDDFLTSSRVVRL